MLQQFDSLERLGELFGPMVGTYSFEKHLAIAALLAVLAPSGAFLIATVRGLTRAEAVYCARQVGLGMLFALPFFTFPLAFYFLIRGYWLAATASAATATSKA